MTYKITKFIASMAASASLATGAFAQDSGSHEGHDHAKSSASESGKFDWSVKTPPSDVDFIYTAAPEDHAIGDGLAPHTLIVYASVVCGHCGRWFKEDYPIIKERLIDTGKLRLIFREFPTQPADVAVAGFQIANCAAPEDYFGAIVYQFQNQDETFDRLRKGEGRARFLELSEKAGIANEDDMIACFESEDGKARLETAMKRAQAGKVEAVPALILDERLMPGLNGAREVLQALGEPVGG